ncbi:esterase-like activity of phytase family protein [Psychroflexus planctonicus]|uniref:Phytase-like domain-containing protein n=1 Tax=Psychroflexus planctonicus TaxID=1526575 RepID=A0ABQ1SI00_9FLAO|nr:esterase-like activity of phytase family protein [Psychroflexus planctonicus]GGE36014.1 hypothetical protein GCM10010832_15260 [Psychroflexus planctonicus]
MKNILFILICFSFISCSVTRIAKEPKYQLKLLDEYVIPAKTFFNTYEIGGLSGIDFKNDTLIFIDDRSTKPIIYTAKWEASDRKIDSLVFIKSTNLKETDATFRKMSMDLESIRFGKNKNFWLTSEGNIKKQKNASVFQIDADGNFKMKMNLPKHLQVNGSNFPFHNRVFEGMTWSFNKDFIWVATELPLENDGKKPQLWNTFSPVRFTQFNSTTGNAQQQFVYQLDRIVRLPFLPFYTNGVTEILILNQDEFLVIERAYSAGRGKRSNRVKLFVTNYKTVSNTLEMEQISKKDQVKTADKHLLLDFKKTRKQLPSKRIDNIEGLCFGPTLANGNKSLLFVSDNNFNSFGEQITQIIWMELAE